MIRRHTFPYKRFMRRFKSVLHDQRWSLGGVVVLAMIVVAVNQLVSHGVVVGNSSPSVPTGIYITSPPHSATYVSFCLSQRHVEIAQKGHFCNPNSPDTKRILKRISERQSNGALIVIGDTNTSLDSRVLGAIKPENIKGWWHPFVTFEPSRETASPIMTSHRGTLR